MDTVQRMIAARARLLDATALDPPTVCALARTAGLSTGHFIALHKAMFGETPHQARTRARLQWAKIELGRGQRSVTEVCMALGYSSVGSFSALFSRCVGRSPSAYRRRWIQVPGSFEADVTPGCLGLMALAFARLPSI